MRNLYHYTSIERWKLILADERILTTESNISAVRDDAGPPVVWLTTDADLEHGHGLRNTLDGTDKSRVRIEVALPNRLVAKWRDFAFAHGIDRDWYARLNEAAGGGASTWRITTNPIAADRWVEVVDMTTDAALWRPS